MSALNIVTAQLSIDEGVRSKPYRDPTGKLTIGIGRNLSDVGLRPDEIDLMLRNDVAQAECDARTWLGATSYEALTERRRAVVINMAFNMGLPTLSQFRSTRAAIVTGRYDEAAAGMLNSKWARQVGARAQRLASEMRSG